MQLRKSLSISATMALLAALVVPASASALEEKKTRQLALVKTVFWLAG